MKKLLTMIGAAAVVAAAIPAFAAINFDVASGSTVTNTFGSPVGTGETAKANINSAETFAFRSGTVNINAGGSVKTGGGKTSNSAYGNWIGTGSNIATLNINGGTFESYGSSSSTPYGLLRIGVNGGSNDSTVNLNSGSLKARVAIIGGSLYNGHNACAKNGVVNINGGTAEIETLYFGAKLSAAPSANGGGYANATLNLTGGTLKVSKFTFNAYHNQTFNWGGGTLVSKAANVFSTSNLLENCTRTVKVSGTPAVFNTGNFAQTLPAHITSGSGTLKLTGGNTVTLSAAPSFGLWLDGTTLVPAGGVLSIPASGTFTFSGSSTVNGSLALGSGANIVCDVDSLFSSSSFTLTATDGFMLPDGGAVLDFVQIHGIGAANCEKTLSADGKTITVSKSGDPNYTWGGTATNWGDVDAWVNCGANATWADGNNAIFATANATVTLDADATAAGVVFAADATIGGRATLTAHSVTVAGGVSATISAPTAGALEKSGAGTLALGSSRSAATAVTEGTLQMFNGSTVSGLALGTDGGAPVVFDYGGQSLQRTPADYLVTGSDVTLTNGTFETSGEMQIRDNTKIPAVLTVAKDATLRQSGGTFVIDKDNGTATVNVIGGTLGRVSNGGSSHIQHRSANGRLNINVTDGGLLTFSYHLYALCNGGAGTSPSLYMMFADSTFSVEGDFNFGNTSSTDYLSTNPTGVFAATNSAVYVADKFVIGYKDNTDKTGGSFAADFESCVVTATCFVVNHDRPLNNVRFNDTRLVFRNAGSIEARTGADNWITVGADGLTIDTQNLSCGLNANLGGSGAVTKVGTGTLAVTSNQTASAAFNVNEGTLAVKGGVSVSRPTTVASGATLAVNATDTATIDTLALEAGSTLNIASYDGRTPLATMALTLPAEGTVNLTLNGGAFAKGVYAIYSKSGVTAADGAKFAPSIGGATATWSVGDDTLLLTVGEVSGNFWIGRGGDGRMSTAANWLNGVPAAGADIDFSIISSAATIIGDLERTFDAVTMGTGVITFTNSFAATSFSDTSKVAVGANSTVTIEGDLEFGTNVTSYICHSIATGGTFAVTGHIVTTAEQTGTLVPCDQTVNEGVISAKGLVNNAESDDHFALARATANALVKWRIGEDGLSGSKRFFMGSRNNVHVMITAATNFTISSGFVVYRHLTLDTAGYEITLGTDTSTKSGGILGGSANGLTTVTGTGKVIVNYNVNDLSTAASSRTNAFTVAGTATLALAHGGNIGFGALTVQDGGTLEIPSGTTTHNGALTLAGGAILAFNYTERGVAPQLALAAGSPMVNGAVTVKVASDCGWPRSGATLLTTCGGFDAAGATVSLAEDAPKWAKDRLYVNADGNIVLDVKPMGLVILFQ